MSPSIHPTNRPIVRSFISLHSLSVTEGQDIPFSLARALQKDRPSSKSEAFFPSLYCEVTVPSFINGLRNQMRPTTKMVTCTCGQVQGGYHWIKEKHRSAFFDHEPCKRIGLCNELFDQDSFPLLLEKSCGLIATGVGSSRAKT